MYWIDRHSVTCSSCGCNTDERECINTGNDDAPYRCLDCGEIEGDMRISRVWAMPSKWTFSVPVIRGFIEKYTTGKWADPFAGEKSYVELTNDIEGRGAKFHLDGLEFLKTLTNNSVDGVLFDPPYSTEQCLRRYTPKHNGTAGRAEYWARCKDEIKRIIRLGGISMCFGWDSTGIGKKRGFEILEILLVCHGACHNDTIITVERKIK